MPTLRPRSRAAQPSGARAGKPRRRASANARTAGGTRAVKGLDLIKQHLDLRRVSRLRGKPQTYVFGIRLTQVRRNGATAEHAHCTDRIDTYQKAWGAPSHAVADDLGRQCGTGRRVNARVGNLGLAENAAIDAHRGLERLRRRLTACADHAHAVFSDFADLHTGDIEHDIGRKIGGRIVNLIEQLLDDGQAVNHAARSRWLGNDDVAVGFNFRYRVPDLRKTGNVLVSGIGKISARHLRAAFEQVPGERASREAIPVFGMPAERM